MALSQIDTTEMSELLQIAKSRVTRQLTTEGKTKCGGARVGPDYSLISAQKITGVGGNQAGISCH